METKLQVEILPQPDETTCGPTCLHAVYRYYGDDHPLPKTISEVRRLDNGGTLATLLGVHALKRGYKATINTYDLRIFDPTWFDDTGRALGIKGWAPGVPAKAPLRDKLAMQAKHQTKRMIRAATEEFIEFIDLGGVVEYEDLTPELIAYYLMRGVPILTGLSATWLYGSPREFGAKSDYDDIRGQPSGHFVVLAGYDRGTAQVLVADPLSPNPWYDKHYYEIDVSRVINAILLGILTQDATMLMITPAEGQEAKRKAKAAAASGGNGAAAPPGAAPTKGGGA